MQLPGLRWEASLSSILFLAMAACIGSVMAISIFIGSQIDRNSVGAIANHRGLRSQAGETGCELVRL